VTINVAKEATDKDHQRLRADDEEVAFDEVILAAVQGSRFKVVRDVAHPILEIEH
jgi:hypothetical protein